MKIFNHIFLLTACSTIVLTACNKADHIASPTQAPVARANANVSDADITTHVKSALNNDSSLAGQDITVVTTKGDVRLTGVVGSQAQVDTVLGAARAAEGAHSIHNELTVKQ
ncbi:BON domain-containing protein [Malikia granosa]|uniref:Transport-associated protein n=1 Tax=Malikia granosa TaxID=263067 RepID=A0A2S9K779_9BURK|nr:BON domain-containing protein [Malikia granosa]PRD66323.1 transport-associated protein [Malikia granosa]